MTSDEYLALENLAKRVDSAVSLERTTRMTNDSEKDIGTTTNEYSNCNARIRSDACRSVALQ